MKTLIIIVIVIGLLIYYVLHLDFEIGTGFTESKKKIREGEYRVVKKENEEVESETKLIE